ncbi:RagB/SusD family nutrient uptake outer membrane protein [Chitinophaga horti]|uniref:RagB/SusD family nutrient uptake outer membrane protein n=1 Tax=Chitinophaga horti TaxID=2920382 RepID=A0ABY6J790_9BACT|nr:RagB/SusD family nutrient uptake outer membrane protein [Chitinophaga horti]UYQ94462.1 RagB/SusD family nutrient uptake outer membrane protein [Chitinophaga horti]
MKKSRYYISALLLLSLAGASCNKQLDELRPHNVIFEEQQFSSPAGYTRALWGAYSSIAGLAVTGGFNYNDIQLFLGEAHGNNIRALDAGVNKNTNAFNYLNSAEKDLSYTHDYWRGSYQALLLINKILDNVKPEETNAEILQAKGEALFLRAYVYFNISRVYGKPYYQDAANSPAVMLVTTANNGTAFAPPRATVKQVYEQVIADLQAALPLLKAQKTNSFASRYAVFGLLSRVYLYMGGTFTQPDVEANKKAREYADSVILHGGYTLLQGAAYTSYYASDAPGNKEDIFAVNAQYNNGSISSLFAMPSQINYSGGLYRPSPDLLAQYQPADLRKKFFVKNVTPGNPNDTLASVKYMLGYVSIYSPSPNRYLRLAEVYLNRAEAAVKAGDNGAALTDLNVIRNRAGIGDTANITGLPLFNEILKQRRMELAFEGHNSFDYFRNGLPMIRNYTSGSSGTMNISATDPKILQRIPADEITGNGNLTQNEQ